VSYRLAFIYIALPILALLGYIAFVQIWPFDERSLTGMRSREIYNPAEWGAALLFLASGMTGMRLAWRTYQRLPRYAVAFYLLFGVAGLVMAGEELSWGQHVLSIESPDFFIKHSKQREINFHNLAGDRPARLLRRVAEIGFPIVLIILPVGHLWLDKRAYSPGHWPFYLLPKGQAIVAIVLGNLIRPMNNLWEIPELDEMGEMLWALGTVFWIAALWQRHAQPRDQASQPEHKHV
jgi:hypothetical protein